MNIREHNDLILTRFVEIVVFTSKIQLSSFFGQSKIILGVNVYDTRFVVTGHSNVFLHLFKAVLIRSLEIWACIAANLFTNKFTK